jgi:hypothetical protein
MAKVKTFIRLHGPDFVFLGTDVAYLSMFVKRCCPTKTKVLVFPYSLCNHQEMIFSALQKNSPACRRTIGKIFFPKWFKDYEGLAIECPATCPKSVQFIFGIQPSNPWVICGGQSDYVLVGSQFEADYFNQSGIDKKRILIVSNKMKSPSLPGEVPGEFLLWSVPPDHLNNRLFKSHEEMVKWHLQIFSQLNCQVVISLHPRLSKTCLKAFKGGKNVHISEMNVHFLIEKCFGLVCSQSSTIRYALQNEKPVINFKIYQLPYTEYDKLAPVRCCMERKEFENAVDSLLSGTFGNNEYSNHPTGYFSGNCSAVDLNILLTKLV